MKSYGFIRVAAATIPTRVANPSYNAGTVMTGLVMEAKEKGVSLLAFPELSVSGYSCGDLFSQNILLERCENEISRLAGMTNGLDMTVIVGAPVRFQGRLFNCAVVIKDGEVKGIVPKTHLPGHGEYCESRWFSSGNLLTHSPTIAYAGSNCIISPNQIFMTGDSTFAIEIGEDLSSPIPPSSFHSLSGAQIIVNPSAGNEIVCRDIKRDRTLGDISHRNICGYIYASACDDSSSDLVFTGHSSVWECGSRLSYNDSCRCCLTIADIDCEKIDTLRRRSTTFLGITPDGVRSDSFNRAYRHISIGKGQDTDFEARLERNIERHPFTPESDLEYRCRKILDLQVRGIKNRLQKIQSKAVIGISGGLDSTLALIVTALAFDALSKDDKERWKPENIIAVTMPGFGTTSRTKNNAWYLMQALGVTCHEISIVPACIQHFKDIGHDPDDHDATYENTQARERTQILMDIANKYGGIVVGTGDLSELALGWATYNGDHMSMYGVNADIPKTLVRSLVQWAAENCFKGTDATDGRSVREILLDIADTPISPELLPADENGEIRQVTEDLVGPYELHDFFLYHFVRFGYSPEKIYFLARKAFSAETGYDGQTIKQWLNTFIRRFFSQQFKRSCMPDGPKVGSVGLSPRGDWHMASDAWSNDFI